MDIGIFGGTFDPIHNGHLAIAEEVRGRLKLAEVIFIPAGRPRLRKEAPVASVPQRVEMVSLAIADRPYFKLSSIEAERIGPTYTVDTIAQLHSQHGSDELFFILGWDSLAELPQWKESSRLIKMCRLVAVPRPGYAAPNLGSLEAAIPGLERRVIMLDEPCIGISATEIRSRMARGLAVDDLVPGPVARYIRESGLYVKQLAKEEDNAGVPGARTGYRNREKN